MLKDILQKLEYPLDGIDFENPPDDLKDKVIAHFNKNLIFKSVAHEDPEITKKIVGRRIGQVETYAKQKLKEFSNITGKDIFKEGELEGKKFEEILDLGFERIQGDVKEIKENASKTDDKKIEKLIADLEVKQRDYQALQSKFDGVIGERDELKNSFEDYKISTKRDAIKNQELSKIKFSETADAYWKKGFFSELDSKYKMELADDNELGYKVINTETKETILDGSKPKEYWRIVEEAAKEAGKLNVNTTTPDKKKEVYKPESNGNENISPGLLRAQQNLQRLQQAGK